MSIAAQPHRPEQISAKAYAAALAARLAFITLMAWFIAASCQVGADLIRGSEVRGLGDYFLEPTLQSIAIAAALAGSLFAATLIRDLLRGRGSRRVWQELGRTAFIMQYNMGSMAFMTVSGGKAASRLTGVRKLWDYYFHRYAFAASIILLGAVAITLRFALGITTDIFTIGFAILVSLQFIASLAFMLWRPEPQSRDAA